MAQTQRAHRTNPRHRDRPKVRAKLLELREVRYQATKAFMVRRAERLARAGWRMVSGSKIMLPARVADEIDAAVKRYRLPYTAVVSAILETGLPHMSASRFDAFWRRYRLVAGDIHEHRSKRFANMMTVMAQRARSRRLTQSSLDSGIAAPVPDREAAADG